MTFTEIASGLDKAIKDTAARKASVDAASKALTDAQAAYSDTISVVKGLHAEYQKLMQDILTLGGTIHK